MSGTFEDFDDTNRQFTEGVFGVAFFMIIAIVTALIILIFVREFYVRKYQIDICPCLELCPKRNRQERRDRRLAENLQRQLDLEQQDPNVLEGNRKDRREWYESYITPYTMIIEKENFFYAQETDEAGATILAERPSPIARQYSSDSTGDGEAVEEVVRSVNYEPRVICTEAGEHARLHLQLPVQGEDGDFRSVEAHCTVCFSEYEEGDQVVWSGLSCRHAFHYDCMMPWLVKGKKRCPICRDWFVPGTKIEDQKRELAERLERESNTSSIETTTTDDGSTRDGTSSIGACSVDDSECQSSAELQGREKNDTPRSGSDFQDDLSIAIEPEQSA